MEKNCDVYSRYQILKGTCAGGATIFCVGPLVNISPNFRPLPVKLSSLQALSVFQVAKSLCFYRL